MTIERDRIYTVLEVALYYNRSFQYIARVMADRRREPPRRRYSQEVSAKYPKMWQLGGSRGPWEIDGKTWLAHIEASQEKRTAVTKKIAERWGEIANY